MMGEEYEIVIQGGDEILIRFNGDTIARRHEGGMLLPVLKSRRRKRWIHSAIRDHQRLLAIGLPVTFRNR